MRRRLGAEHPADGVDDVRLARPVRAHHDGDARLELERSGVGEGLEALEGERLQEHPLANLVAPHCARRAPSRANEGGAVSPATHARALVLEAPRHLVERDVELPEVGRRRRAPAGGGVRPVRHRPRAVHRPAPPGPTPSSRATRPSGSSRSSATAAAERWGVRRGDRVAVEVFQSCRECDACRRGDHRHCERHGIADHVRLPGRRASRRACGAATPRTSTSAPTRCCCPVPDGARPGRSPRCSTRSAPASGGA